MRGSVESRLKTVEDGEGGGRGRSTRRFDVTERVKKGHDGQGCRELR